MLYFLDTNVCIDALRGSHPSIRERMRRLSPRSMRIASIVRAELLLGAAKSQNPRRAQSAVEEFLAPFEVTPFGERAATTYATIRARLETRGTVIGPNDLILASTVLAEGGTLVSRNTREFGRIEELPIDDWTRPDQQTIGRE